MNPEDKYEAMCDYDEGQQSEGYEEGYATAYKEIAEKLRAILETSPMNQIYAIKELFEELED